MKSRSTTAACAWVLAVAFGLLGAAHAAEDVEMSEQERAEVQRKLEAAQKRLDEAAREVANLSMSMSERAMPHVMAFRGFGAKAVLGVQVPSGRRDTRDDGAEILSVSPGGGAAEAGLRPGDVLTHINGKSLKRSGDQGPGEQVRAAMREIEPGSKVTVQYLRDGKPATATIVAKAPADNMFNFRVAPHAGVRAMPFQHFGFMRAHGLFGSAELVSLTPKLGQYFGTEKGLLVVRAPNDARLKLEEGDVILDIDGRIPSSPSHALQILTSYEAGERLKLNVLRMKKRVSFDVTIPESAGPHWESGSRIPPRGDVLIPTPAMPMPPPLPPGAGPEIRREIRVVTPPGEGVV